MGKFGLETRVNKLEKLVGKSVDSSDSLEKLTDEELAVLAVAVAWDLNGVLEELKVPIENSGGESLKIEEFLAVPMFNQWALDGWNSLASEEVKKAYPDIPNKISALKETQ